MKRRVLAIFLLMTLLLGLTACADAQQTIQQTAQTVQQIASALDDAQADAA